MTAGPESPRRGPSPETASSPANAKTAMPGKRRPIENSWAWYTRALDVVPGGTQLVSRRPAIFAEGVAPIFARRGAGPRIWDVDDQEYIDYGMSVSACILGYADPVVKAAVVRQLDDGVMYSLNHPAEVELAEELCATIPCAEMVRYAKGGGEACALAVRIARGFTGRQRVLFCGYHGWHDWYLAANLGDEAALDRHLLAGIEPTGVPANLEGTAFPFPYGDVAALEAALTAHEGEFACVIMEPMRSALPPEGYLESVARLAREHGAVLIFDEVTTGFRHHVRGVEALLGVTPDVAVFAKSLSNGHAMAAVVGRREVMQPAAEMFISSTNWSDLVGITAARTTLAEIKSRDVPALLRAYGERLMAAFNDAAEATKIDAQLTGMPVCPTVEMLPGEDDELRRKCTALLAQELACRGVLMNAHPMHSAAHGDAELEATAAALREALAVVRHAVTSDRVDEWLRVPLSRPVFRRMVR